MGPQASGGEPAVARYDNEDTRPTSRKELLGFYAYSCAAEAVVIAAVSASYPSSAIAGLGKLMEIVVL